jgi:hypothetical protein
VSLILIAVIVLFLSVSPLRAWMNARRRTAAGAAGKA